MITIVDDDRDGEWLWRDCEEREGSRGRLFIYCEKMKSSSPVKNCKEIVVMVDGRV